MQALCGLYTMEQFRNYVLQFDSAPITYYRFINLFYYIKRYTFGLLSTYFKNIGVTWRSLITGCISVFDHLSS